MTVHERLALYPPIEPFRSGMLDVGDGHTIYYEECGNPNGQPAVLVHGGPGGGLNPTMRRFHDPSHYRIILFDQRGCGRSTPNASLEANTTWHLVADMELLRQKLGIERWQIFGGSWGSTLALAYAETHPERVTSLILRGIFLVRWAELEWFYQEGCSWIYPDAFSAFQAPIPPEERGDMIAAYYRRLTDPSPQVRLTAAKAWSIWEGSTLSLLQDPERIRQFGADAYAIAFARIECHYFVNGGFFERDDQLIANAGRLAGIPGTIVHGRYDVVTPLKNAWDLKQAWPEADLRIVVDAGHAMSEPGIAHELVSATRKHRIS
ncbi:putative proline iminopeptidase [Hyphomicrobium sp. 1Nfss2.1]|uniref:prolyl aminopeptidase n=1 Tax=Hyphomicrobium sp. 1Nfss2.1 TaxID=3413936 RepID=UPI003C7DB300